MGVSSCSLFHGRRGFRPGVCHVLFPVSRRVDRGPRTISGSMRQSDDSARDGAVISKKRSGRAFGPVPEPKRPGQQVSDNDNAQTSDEGTGDTTYAFPAHLFGELDAPAAQGVEPRVSAGEGSSSRSAVLLVMRGPNAGSQFVLDQPCTSAGR